MSAHSRLTFALAASLALATAMAPALAGDDVQPAKASESAPKTTETSPEKSADMDRVAGFMKRLDRGKSHLDRAKKLKVAALRDSALEKAALTFERALEDVASSESEILIVLAGETRSLLVTALNARARLELDRERPARAKRHNDRAHELDRDDRSTKQLAETIAQELVPKDPAPVAPAAQPVAAAKQADAERDAYQDGYRDGLEDGRRTRVGLFDLVSSRRLRDRSYRGRSPSDRRVERRRDRRRYGSGYGVGNTGRGHHVRRQSDDAPPQGTPRGRSYSTPNFAPTVGGGSRGFGPLIVDPRPY